jgi:hypothetical protein
MGVIVNPRGTSGSGKTELVRRIAAEYGWNDGAANPIHREGRERPIAYHLPHPLGHRPLLLLGDYRATSGGCDTIRLADGGMDEAFRLADHYAARGHDVLLEGLLLSSEYHRSTMLAALHKFYIIHLDTPLDRCISNVIARQRASGSRRLSAARTATMHYSNIEEACRKHQGHAIVEILDFDGAFRRVRHLLGLDRSAPADLSPSLHALGELARRELQSIPKDPTLNIIRSPE